ncbi:PPC domain-containing protein [Planctomicrobium sp. SH664]|uniref:PPC domain-containing protein n=1 Tax=Planctomicrobium sp. SH664 TaxID=3448125 RepID=UPI003F5B7DB0
MRKQWIVGLGLLICTTHAWGASPVLSNLQPVGGQRGTEVVLTLSGRALRDLEDIVVHEPGLEVSEVKANPNGNSATVRIRIAPDCELGPRRIRARTSTGISDFQIFYVTALPIQAEKEPNNSIAAAQALPLNSTAAGKIELKDVDLYVIEARQGERVSAEVCGMRLGRSAGRTLFDPSLSVLTEEGQVLVANDDSTVLWTDPCVSFIAPRDGKYFIQVNDSIHFGDARSDYLLHVGNFVRPTGVFPLGGQPGTETEFTFLGDPNGALTQKIKLPEAAAEKHFVHHTHEQGITPTGLPVRVSALTEVFEVEPNNSADKAVDAVVPGAFNGTIATPGDQDTYRFTAKKGERYTIEVYARRLRSRLDPSFHISAKDGKTLVSNDDRNGPDSGADFTVPADGEYTLTVYDQLKRGAEDFVYRVEVTPTQPAVYASVLDVDRYIQPQIAVPRGAAFGMLVNIRRDGCSGPVQFESTDLPPGVHIDCPEDSRGTTQIPLMIYADEDAPLSGTASTIRAVLVDPAKPDLRVQNPLTQEYLMTRFFNNQAVWIEKFDTIAIAVTEPAPFRCWIEPPAVPIVRGGTLQLKVCCERLAGWEGDISVRTLKEVPGTTSNRSIVIPKGQTEALIPINATTTAGLGQSQVTIRCAATVDGTQLQFCTPLVPVTVEEPYLTVAFGEGVVRQGGEIPYVLTLTQRKAFEGEATAELVGLPAKVTAEKVQFNKEAKEIRFTIKAAADAPPASTKDLLCRIDIPENGAEVKHQFGSGKLRIDRAPQSTPQPAATTASAVPQSRLQQLRERKAAPAATTEATK